MLYEHQRQIIEEDKKWTGIWLGTGSAKTLIALCLARGKTLVICPKTQKEDQNWEREIVKHKLKVDLTVISKETFRRDADIIKRYDTVIIDEAHTALGVTPYIKYRNKQPLPKASQIFEAVERYVLNNKPDRLYLVTATIMKSPMTVWAGGRLLGKRWDFYEWRSTYYKPVRIRNREIWLPRTDQKTKESLAMAARSIGYVGRLEDYFDVPPQTHKVIHLELTGAQKARIKEMRTEYPEPIVRVGKTHQIENGVLSGNEFKSQEYFSNEKVDKILEYAIEFPRMVIFAKYTAQIEMIAKALRDDGRKVLILDGSTKDRKGLLADANASPECIVIAQSQVSAGWELPLYPCMIFASQSYSFVDHDQSIGRIQRASNIKKNLYIYLVVKGGVDEAVYKCIQQKNDFNEKLYGN